MLAIKLQRIGKKHQASFRFVVGEKRSKLNGRQVEDLGWYNPTSKKHEINKERVLHWMHKGAQATDTVHNLLVTAGVISEKKRSVHKASKKQATGGKAEAEKKEETAPAKEEPTPAAAEGAAN